MDLKELVHLFDFSKYEKYVSLILRLTLGFVFLWAGYGKLTTPNHPAIELVKNLGFIPLDPVTWVFFQAVVEIVLGLLLILGFFTNLAAAVVALFLVLSVIFLDFSMVWKDIALLGSALALVVLGAKHFSIDSKIEKPQRIPK